MNIRTVVSGSGAGAILLAEAGQILGQVLLPYAGVGGPGSVDRADARIRIGLERRVGMGAAAGVVGAVGDGGDAGVKERQHGDEVADIDVVRAVLDGEIAVQRIHIIGEVDVGDDTAELVLPAVAMAVDDAGRENHPAGLDDDRAAVVPRGGEVPANRCDSAAVDEKIALVEIPDGGIHGDDGRALERMRALSPAPSMRSLRAAHSAGPCS